MKQQHVSHQVHLPLRPVAVVNNRRIISTKAVSYPSFLPIKTPEIKQIKDEVVKSKENSPKKISNDKIEYPNTLCLGIDSICVNAGELVCGAPILRLGVSKTGKAQSGRLLMVANIDPRSKKLLLNPYSTNNETEIKINHSDSVCSMKIKYTTLSHHSGVSAWETGECRNTCIVSKEGKSEWINHKFISLAQDGNLNGAIIFSGKNTQTLNSFALEAENRTNFQLQVLVEIETLTLAH